MDVRFWELFASRIDWIFRRRRSRWRTLWVMRTFTNTSPVSGGASPNSNSVNTSTISPLQSPILAKSPRRNYATSKSQSNTSLQAHFERHFDRTNSTTSEKSAPDSREKGNTLPRGWVRQAVMGVLRWKEMPTGRSSDNIPKVALQVIIITHRASLCVSQIIILKLLRNAARCALWIYWWRSSDQSCMQKLSISRFDSIFFGARKLSVIILMLVSLLLYRWWGRARGRISCMARDLKSVRATKFKFEGALRREYSSPGVVKSAGAHFAAVVKMIEGNEPIHHPTMFTVGIHLESRLVRADRRLRTALIHNPGVSKLSRRAAHQCNSDLQFCYFCLKRPRAP